VRKKTVKRSWLVRKKQWAGKKGERKQSQNNKWDDKKGIKMRLRGSGGDRKKIGGQNRVAHNRDRMNAGKTRRHTFPERQTSLHDNDAGASTVGAILTHTHLGNYARMHTHRGADEGRPTSWAHGYGWVGGGMEGRVL
jgi:hypothetical protein